VQRVQIFVSEERLPAGERIPRVGLDILERRRDFDRHCAAGKLAIA
jgi:hypothetical protein